VIKIPKIILDKEDILELIKKEYGECEITNDVSDELEIIIKVKEVKKKIMQPSQGEQKKLVIENGSIDAEKSGLSLKNREKTIPGGAMGRRRNALPTF